MSLQGLPDFQQPLFGEGFQLYFPYEAAGSHTVVPARLEIDARNDGTPDFSLELVRGANPLLPPKPYGILDFRLRPRYRMEEALAFLRTKQTTATLGYPLFTSGFLRLHSAALASDFPDELKTPIPLGWNGLSVARFILRMSGDAAAIIKDSLQSELVSIVAVAVLEMEGVSPRLPLRVRFNPAELMKALNDLSHDRRVQRDALVTYFRKDPGKLPLIFEGALPDGNRNDFAEAMADLVRIHFAGLAAPLPDSIESCLELVSPESVGSGTFEWDFAEPHRVSRGLVLGLDPFEAARQLVQSHGLAAVVHETTVPSIQTGAHKVSISANLPAQRPDVLSCGVTLHAPPAPPFRMQAVVESVELSPPSDSATVTLKLAPKEPLRYQYSAFLVVQSGASVQQLNGPETAHQGEDLGLLVTDFPADFFPVEASPALLQLAVIDGICRGESAGAPVERSLHLSSQQPATSLVLPKGTANIRIEIDAHAKDGSGSLHLNVPVAANLFLDLSSFHEFGSQTVAVECVFGASDSIVAIDLLPAGRPETANEIAVLFLTPAAPRKTWTYFAASPFQSKYRYRFHKNPDEPPAPWSDFVAPSEALKLVH